MNKGAVYLFTILLCLFDHALKAQVDSSRANILRDSKNDSVIQNKTQVPQKDTARQKTITGIEINKKNFLQQNLKGASLQAPSLSVPRVSPGSLGSKLTSRASCISKGLLKDFLKLSSHGTISIGYDYGVVPFVNNGPIPAGYIRAEGHMSLKLFDLPFNANFFYSDLNNVPTVVNYFRIVYDQNKFKQDMNDKIALQEGQLRGQVNSLYQEKQVIEQRLYYLRSLDLGKENFSMPNMNLPKTSLPGTGFPSTNLPNTNLHGTGLPADSTGKGMKDSLSRSANEAKQAYQGAMNTANSVEHKADSVKGQIKKYEAELSTYEKKIKDLNNSIETLSNPKTILDKYGKGNPYAEKVKKLFSHIKKLEIGMCYPNYSTFLVSGIAVKGINVEYQKDDFFLACTGGSTVNTLLFTTNAVQNKLSNVQNLFNYFDFNYVNNSRHIAAVKFGYGKTEGDHVYIGFLYGAGLQSYVPSTTSTNPMLDAPITPDKNFVVEFDGKYIIGKNSDFNLVYGRSTIQTGGQYTNGNEGAMNALFNNSRSNACMVKYNLTRKETKTKLTLTGRWIDPFFKSYGVGFMRPDNLRYEVKVEQPIGNKVKLTAFYRNDEDNILNLYNYKNVLRTIGTNVSIKLKKSLSLRLGFNPVIQTVTTTDNSYSAHNMNSISSAVLSYNPTLRHGSSMFNLMFNNYVLTTGGQTSNFETVTITNLTQFKNGFRNNFTAGWFRTNSSADSTIKNNNTWLISDELGYTMKGGYSVSGGLKASYNANADWQYGYLLKASVPLRPHITLTLNAEKLVTGDFYNSLNYGMINNFPYYIYLRLEINW